MRRLLRGTCIAALLALCVGSLLPSACPAHTYHVSPDGTEWYDTFQYAAYYATSDDTVMAAPGTYVIDSTDMWPIELGDSDKCPWFVSRHGAEVTIIQGDGTTPAFAVRDVFDSPHIRITGFTIRGASSPIEQDPGFGGTVGALIIEDCIIEENGEGIDLYNGYGRVSRNVIRNNGDDGIQIDYFDDVVEGNEITGNEGYGICARVAWTGGHIQDNLISGNASGGIHMYWGPRVLRNIIEDNGGPGVIVGCSGSVEDNIIRRNELGIRIFDEGTTLGHVNGNDLYDNGTYDFYVHSGYNPWPHTFDATLNWWGTTDPLEIAERIYNADDDPSIEIIVLYDPWCTAPGCDPTGVEPSSWGTIKALYR